MLELKVFDADLPIMILLILIRRPNGPFVQLSYLSVCSLFP